MFASLADLLCTKLIFSIDCVFWKPGLPESCIWVYIYCSVSDIVTCLLNATSIKRYTYFWTPSQLESCLLCPYSHWWADRWRGHKSSVVSESFFLFFYFWKILSTAVSCLQVELYFPFQKKASREENSKIGHIFYVGYNCMNVKKKVKKIPCEGAGGLGWHSPDEWKLKNNTSPNVWHTQPQITHAAISLFPREIHLAQTPVRDNSLILPRCSLPDLCPPERSTDNLLSCSGVRVSESHWSVFFLTLKSGERCSRGRWGGMWVRRREPARIPRRWQRCRLSQEVLE